MINTAFAIEGITAIELNLACPNIPGKPVTAYDFELLDEVLKTVTSLPLYGTKPLGVKLAPYFDMPEFEKAATVLAKYPIQYVVTINSLCNALVVDADTESVGMAAKNGFGGLGGGFIKPTALANIAQLHQRLAEKGRPDIDLVAVGGVSTGRDAFEFILCGAKAVQVATCHWNEGPTCFDRIAAELEEIMRSKGYKSIEDFRGKLKPYSQPPSTTAAKTTGAGAGAMKKIAGDISVGSLTRKLRESPTQLVMPAIIVCLSVTIAYLLAAKK
jgi:dihydroorotate dehydrogenase (fumarate)